MPAHGHGGFDPRSQANRPAKAKLPPSSSPALWALGTELATERFPCPCASHQKQTKHHSPQGGGGLLCLQIWPADASHPSEPSLPWWGSSHVLLKGREGKLHRDRDGDRDRTGMGTGTGMGRISRSREASCLSLTGEARSRLGTRTPPGPGVTGTGTRTPPGPCEGPLVRLPAKSWPESGCSLCREKDGSNTRKAGARIPSGAFVTTTNPPPVTVPSPGRSECPTERSSRREVQDRPLRGWFSARTAAAPGPGRAGDTPALLLHSAPIPSRSSLIQWALGASGGAVAAPQVSEIRWGTSSTAGPSG